MYVRTKFVVEIDDVGHAGFQKASELSVEVASVQYFEGGSLIPNKSPDRLDALAILGVPWLIAEGPLSESTRRW